MGVGARTPIVAGNWKMNGALSESRDLVAALAAGVGEGSDAEMLLCPPFVYLDAAARWLESTRIGLGAQDIASEVKPGAYTGEIAGAMLADVGCTHVIVGHSERRTLYGETDDQVVAKFRAAQAAGLVPILCVGETLAEREGQAYG